MSYRNVAISWCSHIFPSDMAAEYRPAGDQAAATSSGWQKANCGGGLAAPTLGRVSPTLAVPGLKMELLTLILALPSLLTSSGSEGGEKVKEGWGVGVAGKRDVGNVGKVEG